MIRNDVKWRREVGVSKILESFPKNKYFQACIDYWPGAWHGPDKEGVPVWYERVGIVDPKGFTKAVPLEDLIEFHIFLMERGERMIEEWAKEHGFCPEGNVVVQDCSGLGWKHLYSPGLNAVRRTVEIDEAHYPERLKILIAVNAPSIFTVFWKILKNWLDPRTIAKIQIVGTDFMPTLEQHVDKKYAPKYLGGPCTQCQGECVKGGGTFGNATSENKDLVEVVVTDKHRKRIRADKKGVSIGWEFRSTGYDIGFVVTREDLGAESMPVEVHPYSRCDPDRLIQGRIVAETPGYYTLEWDNSYSMMRTKSLSYQVYVDEPLETAENTNKKKKKKKKKKKQAEELTDSDPGLAQ
jgi:hypothetical protein